MKQKVGVSKSGSWAFFWTLMLIFGWNLFFIPILYWLFKLKKTKTYQYI